MKRRRENDNGDCLELLLDTMCNTFGGIMFIAMALVVISSMLPSPSVKKVEVKEKVVEQPQSAQNKAENREITELETKILQEKEDLEKLRELLAQHEKQWTANFESLKILTKKQKTPQNQPVSAKTPLWVIVKKNNYFLLNRDNSSLMGRDGKWQFRDGIKWNFDKKHKTITIFIGQSIGANFDDFVQITENFSTEKFYIKARVADDTTSFKNWQHSREILTKSFAVEWLPEIELDEMKILIKGDKNEL